tara:strand:- start:207 stop:1358 length:1152 start_codon:yes stop_codon:yes gene_type:complete
MSTLKVDAIRHNSATSDAITTAADGTCTAKLTSIGGGGLSHRNIIINGAMNVAQRSSSVAVSDGSNEGYNSLDRYKTYTNNSGAYTVSQDTDVPTDYSFGRFRNSYKVDVTTADTSIGASDLIRVEQDIEAQDISNSGWDYTSSNGKLTLSFWVKSVKAGTYVVVVQTADGTAHSYALEYTLSANTWTHVTKTIPGNSNLTIDDDNGVGLRIHWILCSGSDNNLTADTWTSGLKYGTTNQANLFDSTSNNWYLTGVQLEVGDTATTFEHRSHGDELRRCQRYYYQFEIFPNQVVNFLSAYGSTYGKVQYSFPVTMRANPTGGLLDIGGVQEYLNGTWNNRTLSIAGTRKDFVQIFNQRSDSGFGGQYVRASSGTPICTLNAEL